SHPTCLLDSDRHWGASLMSPGDPFAYRSPAAKTPNNLGTTPPRKTCVDDKDRVFAFFSNESPRPGQNLKSFVVVSFETGDKNRGQTLISVPPITIELIVCPEKLGSDTDFCPRFQKTPLPKVLNEFRILPVFIY